MKYLALAASLLSMVPAQRSTATGPPLRIKLSDDRLALGDRERVRIRTEKDGYVVVLRMDAEGRVHVLYPLDPVDNNAVRGRKEFEVRSRGDREAFTVSEHTGSGLVLAARADTPFNFSAFMTGDRWSADALTPPNARDPEAALLSVVDRMTSAHYDYDAVTYTVGAPSRQRSYAAPYMSGWYDPFFYGAYYPWPYYYSTPFGFRSTIIVPVRPRHLHRR